MNEQSTRGIIWHMKPYQEKDMLMTFLTEQSGKITLIAKGVRGKNSKRSGTLQPFSCISFSHTVPKTHSGLARLIRSEFEYGLTSSDPLILAELSLLAEVCRRFVEEWHAIPEIFALWEQFLHVEFRKPREEICGFLVQFFSLLGVFPEFQKCGKTNIKFTAEDSIHWIDAEGIYASAEENSVYSNANKNLTFEQVKCLFFFQHTSVDNFSKLKLSENESKELMDIIFQEITALSDKPFAAKKVFEALL